LRFSLSSRARRKITWREGTAQALSSRFARVRVRAAHRDYWLAESRPEEWLLIEWPEGEKSPTKYWFSTFPPNIPLSARRHRQAALGHRARLPRTQAVGHFEGRGWRGFHHHAMLCIAAYRFLVSERQTISP
jgi:SRSO17 transposase